MAAFSPPRLFAAWRDEAPFSPVSRFDGFYTWCHLLSRCVIVHDAASCPREGSLSECGRPCDALSCLVSLLYCPVASEHPIHSGAGGPVSEGYRSHLFQNVPDQNCYLLTSRAYVLGVVDPFARFDLSSSSLSPGVPCDEQQRGDLPASTRSRWRQDALQAPPQVLQRTTGWDGCGPFLSEGMRCITWNTRGLVESMFSKQKNREFKLKYLKKFFDTTNILCLQEVYGKDEYRQAIQVLAPRFWFFGTFIPVNENAGGSAICIHRDILPQGAIVTHLITCQGPRSYCPHTIWETKTQ